MLISEKQLQMLLKIVCLIFCVCLAAMVVEFGLISKSVDEISAHTIGQCE